MACNITIPSTTIIGGAYDGRPRYSVSFRYTQGHNTVLAIQEMNGTGTKFIIENGTWQRKVLKIGLQGNIEADIKCIEHLRRAGADHLFPNFEILPDSEIQIDIRGCQGVDIELATKYEDLKISPKLNINKCLPQFTVDGVMIKANENFESWKDCWLKLKGELKGKRMYVMTRYETLYAALKKTPSHLRGENLSFLGFSLINIVNELHMCQVLHGDIKLANLLFRTLPGKTLDSLLKEPMQEVGELAFTDIGSLMPFPGSKHGAERTNSRPYSTPGSIDWVAFLTRLNSELWEGTYAVFEQGNVLPEACQQYVAHARIEYDTTFQRVAYLGIQDAALQSAILSKVPDITIAPDLFKLLFEIRPFVTEGYTPQSDMSSVGLVLLQSVLVLDKDIDSQRIIEPWTRSDQAFTQQDAFAKVHKVIESIIAADLKIKVNLDGHRVALNQLAVELIKPLALIEDGFQRYQGQSTWKRAVSHLPWASPTEPLISFCLPEDWGRKTMGKKEELQTALKEHDTRLGDYRLSLLAQDGVSAPDEEGGAKQAEVGVPKVAEVQGKESNPIDVDALADVKPVIADVGAPQVAEGPGAQENLVHGGGARPFTNAPLPHVGSRNKNKPHMAGDARHPEFGMSALSMKSPLRQMPHTMGMRQPRFDSMAPIIGGPRASFSGAPQNSSILPLDKAVGSSSGSGSTGAKPTPESSYYIVPIAVHQTSSSTLSITYPSVFKSRTRKSIFRCGACKLVSLARPHKDHWVFKDGKNKCPAMQYVQKSVMNGKGFAPEKTKEELVAMNAPVVMIMGDRVVEVETGLVVGWLAENGGKVEGEGNDNQGED